VEECSLTSTQRQQTFKTALYLKEIGIPIPTKFLIDNMSIPNKDELIEQIQAIEKQQSDQQKKQFDMELQQIQIDNETKLSYSDSQKALAQERINKTQLDAAVSAERLQRADSDRTAAILNLIKAAKEIQSMDIEHLERAVALAKQVGEEDEEESGIKDKLEQVASNIQTPHTMVGNPPQSGGNEGEGEVGQGQAMQGIQGLIGQ
jgi:hypothetical protein